MTNALFCSLKKKKPNALFDTSFNLLIFSIKLIHLWLITLIKFVNNNINLRMAMNIRQKQT